MNTINRDAPIIPFCGLEGIKLYSTRDELRELLEKENVESKVLFDEWIQYDIDNSIELLFHLKNNKLFRITTLENYHGKLFEKIGIGTTEEELLEIEPSFVEMDAETNVVKWISVYIPELDSEEFEECKW